MRGQCWASGSPLATAAQGKTPLELTRLPFLWPSKIKSSLSVADLKASSPPSQCMIPPRAGLLHSSLSSGMASPIRQQSCEIFSFRPPALHPHNWATTPGQPRLHLPAHGDTQGCACRVPCLDSMPGPWAARPWVLTISDSRICQSVHRTPQHFLGGGSSILHTPVLREPP